LKGCGRFAPMRALRADAGASRRCGRFAPMRALRADPGCRMRDAALLGYDFFISILILPL